MSDSDPQSQADHTGRFRLAMASSGIGMAIVDLDGRWLEVNPAFERMLGYPAAEIVGRTADSITHPDDVAPSAGWLQDLGAGSLAVLDATKRYLHRDGSVVWTHANVAAMRGPDGTAAYLIVQLRDITAQRQAEEALRSWNASLEARVAERTAALELATRQQELFAYGISHDLRAPLRTIEGFSALLASRQGDVLDEVARDHLARIRAAAGRMGTLIDALLELSRASRSELKCADVDLSLLADWVGAELQDANPGRPARIEVQPGLRARGDERHLKLVLNQLLDNAWKFSAARPQVDIAISGETRGDRLHVAIRDQGSGFDTRYIDRLFEPFQRLHGTDEGAGHGLGLAVALRIVERHGGSLRAESVQGAGSVFHLELPAAVDSADATGTRPA